MAPRELAQSSLQAVALGQGTAVPGHHDREARPTRRRIGHKDIDRPRDRSSPAAEGPSNVGSGAEAGLAREALARRTGIPPRQRVRRFLGRSSLTVSRWRPFLRRRARTLRPAFVFIRARKPWSRIRFLLLGFLYVGCMALVARLG